MSKYEGGLNFIPMLAQSPMNRKHSCRRACQNSSSLTLKETSFTCYNGNYEGDSSMFGGPEHRVTAISPSGLDLIETDSDTEYKREMERYEGPSNHEEQLSQPRRLWNHFKMRLINDKRLEPVAKFMEQMRENYYYKALYEVFSVVFSLLLYVLRWLLTSLVNIGNWSYGLWRCKTFLRQTARRLLWWMTLSKCGDTMFFALILMGTPLLFVVSVFGFLLSTYCSLKDFLNHSGYFIRDRVF